MTESDGQPASAIASLWRHRWLMKRIQSADVLLKVAGANAGRLADFFTAAGVQSEEGEGGEEQAELPIKPQKSSW